MIKIYFIFFIVFMFSTPTFAKESFVGNYSRTPQGETVIKITKSNGVYYMVMNSNVFKNLPGTHSIKTPKKMKWSKKEQGKKVANSHLYHMLGENWNTKVKLGLHFNEMFAALLRLKDNYKIDDNFTISKKDIYAKHQNVNSPAQKSNYVFTIMYWYFDVYKQK